MVMICVIIIYLFGNNWVVITQVVYFCFDNTSQ